MSPQGPGPCLGNPRALDGTCSGSFTQLPPVQQRLGFGLDLGAYGHYQGGGGGGSGGSSRSGSKVGIPLSLGGEGHRRGAGGEQEADHREEVLLQLALLQTGLTRKSKGPPLEGKKEKRDKDGCKGET